MEENKITIPVMLDSKKEYPNFMFTRCNYFSIESHLPSLGWYLNIVNFHIPILLLDISGIIIGPIDGHEFNDSLQIITDFRGTVSI